MTRIELIDQLATEYGFISRTAVQTAVDTYAGQLQDEDLYNTEADTLSKDGVECIRAQFVADYDGSAMATLQDELRAEIRATTAQLDELPAKRDALIRQAISSGVRVVDIADDSGLKPARIYQIRDNRR